MTINSHRFGKGDKVVAMKRNSFFTASLMAGNKEQLIAFRTYVSLKACLTMVHFGGGVWVFCTIVAKYIRFTELKILLK